MRIASSSVADAMLASLMNAQRDFVDSQVQASSGKQAQDLAGMGRKAELSAVYRSAETRAQSRIDAAELAGARLEMQATALNSLREATEEFRKAAQQAKASGTSLGLDGNVTAAFNKAVIAVNIAQEGRFLFSGKSVDVQPLQIDSLDDLVPLASASVAFNNDNNRPAADLGAEGAIDLGQLASDVAVPLFDTFKLYADYVSANGAFTGADLTPAQSSFLDTIINSSETALQNVVKYEGINGLNQERAERAVQAQTVLRDNFINFRSKVEDVDGVEAAARLQRTQTAYEGAAATFAKLSSVSLLDFLR